MRTKMDQILGLLAPKDKALLAEMLKDKENAGKIREYLKKLESLIKKNKVEASVNPDNYQWMRFKGKITKSIPYAGMIVKLEPETIIGFTQEVDSLGKFKVIIPVFKRFPISLESDLVDLIKAKCKPFTGNTKNLLIRKG